VAAPGAGVCRGAGVPGGAGTSRATGDERPGTHSGRRGAGRERHDVEISCTVYTTYLVYF